MLIGMVLVGVGTFFAQATATGFVGRAATSDRGSASGLYLACYFFGGLDRQRRARQIFDMFGWAGLRRRHRRVARGRRAARPLPQDAGGARGDEHAAASPLHARRRRRRPIPPRTKKPAGLSLPVRNQTLRRRA